jgi:predicted MPP superfamily phosphohydrolase
MFTRLILAAVLLMPQAYLFLRFRRWINTRDRKVQSLRVPVYLLFALSNLLMIGVIATQPRPTNLSAWAIYTIVYPFLLWHSATFIIAIVLLAGAILKLPFKLIWKGLLKVRAMRPKIQSIREHPRTRAFDASRRVFLRRSVYGLTAASFGGTAYGMFIGRNACEMNEREIYVPGLPTEFSGFTIGLVTDVHSSLYMQKRDMDEYVLRMNDLGADIVVIAGDLVNGNVDEVHPFAEAFSRLKAPMGVFGVLGNHDYYTRQPDKIARVATEAGVRMLRNENLVLNRNGSGIMIAGMDDAGSSQVAVQKMDAALRSDRGALPTVLVSHRPYFLEEAAERSVGLVLSGHTHGGQVVFGRMGGTVMTPAALYSPYVWGLYRKKQTQMYVSRGIGTVGVPIRINCPPELTRIVLRPA